MGELGEIWGKYGRTGRNMGNYGNKVERAGFSRKRKESKRRYGKREVETPTLCPPIPLSPFPPIPLSPYPSIYPSPNSLPRSCRAEGYTSVLSLGQPAPFATCHMIGRGKKERTTKQWA